MEIARVGGRQFRVAWCWLVVVLSAGCRTPRDDTFPLGIYSVNRVEDLAVVREAGFNLVTGPAEQGFLDAAAAAGIRVLASPHTMAGAKFSPGEARWAVHLYDSHPALWAWYLADEPDLKRVPPKLVEAAHDTLKEASAQKPTALVLWNAAEALHYGNITDILMVDRYPIPWMPLAQFGQQVRMARLALGKSKPLIAVIQAFDWSCHPELLPGVSDLRPPNEAELRCMTYGALAQRANGILYFAFDSKPWRLLDHPETWDALKRVVAEVNERRPLFEAQHIWWPYFTRYSTWAESWSAALDSSITLALLRVRAGSSRVPSGDYVLAVNTTPRHLDYQFSAPRNGLDKVPVFDENREAEVDEGWVVDNFAPYAVHVYGPIR